MFYSKSTGGFYDPEINETMPGDVVSVSTETYQALLTAQSNGKQIVSDANGNPIAADRVVVAPTIKQQISALESQQTARRIREAVLGVDGGWLAGINTQIAALRAQITAGE